jgi:hypothetical protein
MPYTVVDLPAEYFNTVLYTGDGTTNQTKAITFGFQPDWAWFKARDAGQSHILVDSVRGGTKYLISESTNAEGTLGVAQLFTATGMTISNDASANSLNSSGSTKVSWGWLASNTTVSNTSGSITSTVSANTTSGFSIVSYTGNGGAGTVGHGLGVAPKMVIIKTRSGSGSWVVGHDSMGWGFWIPLDATNAKISSATIFQNTAPTSTVFSENIFDTDACIAYCFADVKGYSKFGSYTGNGNSAGTFVYTGFKPAFVLVKSSSSVDNWFLMDNKRDPFNPEYKIISPNTNSVEDVANPGVTDMDLLSNGFRLTTNWSGWNNNGQVNIYMAFAENPFVSSGGIPTTAR